MSQNVYVQYIYTTLQNEEVFSKELQYTITNLQPLTNYSIAVYTVITRHAEVIDASNYTSKIFSTHAPRKKNVAKRVCYKSILKYTVSHNLLYNVFAQVL